MSSAAGASALPLESSVRRPTHLESLDAMPTEQRSTPAWEARHLRLAIDAAGVGLWSWNVDSDCLSLDETSLVLWDAPRESEVLFEELSKRIHPADRDRVGAAFAATRGAPGPYEIDFRIIVDDEIRWVSARGQGGEAGIDGGMMFGIFLDVTGRKQAEESNELLAGEMSHRVKNLLAIATSLTTMTSRTTTSAEDMARELTGRLMALDRAHDMVRPLPGHQGKATLLGDLVSVVLAPYNDLGAYSGRIRVAVPRMGVGEGSATTLALVLHELATNSLKYGALSAAEGTLDVSCTGQDDNEVVIVWTESGGPVVVEPPASKGFGSRLIRQSVAVQLRGSIDFEWHTDGAVVTIRMDLDRLAR